MSARHRRPVPPRRVSKRVVGAGATGLAAVFAVVPLAHADATVEPAGSSAAPVDTSTGGAAASDVPTTDAPGTGAPSSSMPASDAPSSSTPTSDAPSSSTPTSDAPSSSTPTSDAPSSSVPSTPGRPPATTKTPRAGRLAEPPLADFGTRKVYVQVDPKSGAYLPAGTAGSVIHISEVGPSTPREFDCTTTNTAAGPNTSSGCGADGPLGGAFGSFQAGAGDTVTLTQTSAPDGAVADPSTVVLQPCLTTADPDYPQYAACAPGPFGPSAFVTFVDAGEQPSVLQDDTTVTVPAGEASDVDVDGQQIDEHGAPITSVEVTTEPQHGTLSVVADTPPMARRAAVAVTGPFHFVYTPTDGYVGPDSFAYTVSTANGAAGPVTVALRVVGDAPTVRDDTASTVQGRSVLDDVLANDDANGGGTLSVDAVTAPAHGTATVVDGRIRYTPAADFTGTDTFTYSAGTYSGSGTATVTITVAAAPVTPTPAPSTSSGGTGGNGAAPDDAGTTGATGNTVATADTGTPSAALVEIGGALLLAGAGATVVGRRRRTSGGHA